MVDRFVSRRGTTRHKRHEQRADTVEPSDGCGCFGGSNTSARFIVVVIVADVVVVVVETAVLVLVDVVEVAAYVVAPVPAATAIDDSSLANGGVFADHDTADGVVAVDDDADDNGDDDDEPTDDELMIGRRHDGSADEAARGPSHVAEMPLFIVEMRCSS